MKQKKNYFIFGSYPGAIYYSWLFVILFIGFIFFYESTHGINIFAPIFIFVFILLFIYTLFFSYTEKVSTQTLKVKLPYRKAFEVSLSKDVSMTTTKLSFIKKIIVKIDDKSYQLFQFSRSN